MKFSYYTPHRLNKMTAGDKLYHCLTYLVYCLISLSFVTILIIFLSSVEVGTSCTYLSASNELTDVSHNFNTLMVMLLVYHSVELIRCTLILVSTLIKQANEK